MNKRWWIDDVEESVCARIDHPKRGLSRARAREDREKITELRKEIESLKEYKSIYEGICK